jgi:maleamate amidohydrolase
VSTPHGAAFSGRLGWGTRPALLVVDLVRAYTEPGGPFLLPDPGPAVAATAALVDAARAGGHPVVWTVVRYTEGLADAGPGEPVVVKQYASAFFATWLASTLHTIGVDTVVISGVSTSGCIRASATDALNHGFRPLVVRQACADRSAALHDNNLADLDAKYADVIDLDEAVARLRP